MHFNFIEQEEEDEEEEEVELSGKSLQRETEIDVCEDVSGCCLSDGTETDLK